MRKDFFEHGAFFRSVFVVKNDFFTLSLPIVLHYTQNSAGGAESKIADGNSRPNSASTKHHVKN